MEFNKVITDYKSQQLKIICNWYVCLIFEDHNQSYVYFEYVQDNTCIFTLDIFKHLHTILKQI